MSKTTTSTAVAAGAPGLKRDYVYDGCGSRVMRQVARWNTAVTIWLLEKELRYLDEGSNLVAEVASLKPGSGTVWAMRPLRSNLWGEDLSGTETGAGGVGGLLWCLDYDTTSQTSYRQMAPWYDGNGNGNILGWIENHAAQVKALRRIEYDPFGRLLTSDPLRKPYPLGSGEDSNYDEFPPFGFSTKFEDVETGLLYYGYRYYDPVSGRWPSKDPIEERGGINLYGMVGNDTVNRVDVLGRSEYSKIFNPRFGRILDRLSGSTYSPVNPSAPLGVLFLNFWMRYPARRDDIYDISTTRSLSDIARRVDQNNMKDYFERTVNLHSYKTWAEERGYDQIRFLNKQVTKETHGWQILTLRGWTMDLKIVCTQKIGPTCGGKCEADFQLYDEFDFWPNGLPQWIPYIIFEWIPEPIGLATPFHVKAEWNATYEFDNNFRITKTKNRVY